MIRKAKPRFDPADMASVGQIKHVPADPAVRGRIRESARLAVAGLSRSRPLGREELERLARSLLARLELPHRHLGFTMVALSNAFWRGQFAAVPFSRRLLLLPHCLRKPDVCRGTYSALGLACAGCGACPISPLKAEAEALGYHVLVMEGTPAVVQIVLRGKADAVLGVACLDSLEEAFERVVEMGVPHVAVPLLVNGCVETEAELDEIRSFMQLRTSVAEERTRSYAPLLRSAERLFEPGILDALLSGELQASSNSPSAEVPDPLLGTEAIAVDWLRAGGKRFRPFITLASYAAATLGEQALHPDADLTDAFPEVVQRAAVAVEALHKASLVHDDIEDHDAFRYGRDTLHRRYGVPTAVNVGDYLVGLGYRLIAAGADELSPSCTSDILGALSRSHLRLSRGQGAELLWRDRDPRRLRPLEVLAIYALKTAPAFEAAMTVGLRAAGELTLPAEKLSAYCRYLGVAYQVLNDLKDWRRDDGDKLLAGQDVFSARPTVLLAFAMAASDEDGKDGLAELLRSDLPEAERVERLRRMYQAQGVFDKADALVTKYRGRARALAAGVKPHTLAELMNFILDVVLR